MLSGPVRVEFNNAFAEDPHDLHLARQDGTGPSYAFGTLEAGGIEAKTLNLSAGAWQLFCALPEHALARHDGEADGQPVAGSDRPGG